MASSYNESTAPSKFPADPQRAVPPLIQTNDLSMLEWLYPV